MKIDRLLGILVILLKKEKVTAPYLADYFEVSKRTINRDIETLCKAGIPIATRQGANGGISILDGYKIDNSIYTNNELSSIITGLNALRSISDTKTERNLIDKISVPNVKDEIIKIELGSFYKDSIARKISIIKEGYDNTHALKFTYYSKNGESEKLVTPCNVVYKWDAWYLYGYSIKKNDYRIYKLNRLWDLQETDIIYDCCLCKSINEEKLDNIFSENYKLRAIFHFDIKYLLVEQYGNNCYQEMQDGRLLFERDFTNFDFMLRWVLGFGDMVEVIKPQTLIDKLIDISKGNLDKYDKHDI